MKRFGLAGRAALLGAVAMLTGARAIAATAATMTIGEPQQGKVKGGINKTKGGSPSTVIELLSVTHPGSDAASGSAAGRRSSSGADTLIVTKYYDGNSALLAEAASTNQVLPEVVITFATAAAGNGAVSNPKVKGNSAKGSASGMAAAPPSKTAQTLVLRNVQVTEIDQSRNLQKITIEYQSIEVTYTSGKSAAATDDWETP